MQVQRIQNNNNNYRRSIYFCNKSFIYNNSNSYRNDSVSFTANPVKEVKTIASNLTPERIEEFFNVAGIKFSRNTETGLYSIKTFNGQKKCVQKALKIKKINCDDLFQNIEEIKENAIFEGTNTTNLGKCKKIGGWAVFNSSKVVNLGDLEEVSAASFAGNKLSNFGKLKKARTIDIVYAPKLKKQNIYNIETAFVYRELEQYGTNRACLPAWYEWEVNHDAEFAKQEGFRDGDFIF